MTVSGTARVLDNAHVSGTAHVSGNARVFGTALVYDTARVYGNARVTGNAQVSGNALVSGTARVYGTARVTGTAHVSDHMVIDRADGCVCVGPIGSEHRSATAAWDYDRRELCARVGCWYGSIDELAKRIAPRGGHGWSGKQAKVYRAQYEAFIALARTVAPPTNWPVQS